ncbi:hypothetical protein BGAL_0026g00250 [Botrytis galanthina]|uniref:Uncharacterized protein n=1 Tax=Botrytis galanthina TaxID=278940 RepID=A0A4S8RL99_9HELO|nr:hypothetical protein BGAL_0026g00250 [Botrytis galanthina]
MVRPTGVMLGLEEFRKIPEEFMAKDRKPKNLKGQGRDEERGEGLNRVKPRREILMVAMSRTE